MVTGRELLHFPIYSFTPASNSLRGGKRSIFYPIFPSKNYYFFLIPHEKKHYPSTGISQPLRALAHSPSDLVYSIQDLLITVITSSPESEITGVEQRVDDVDLSSLAATARLKMAAIGAFNSPRRGCRLAFSASPYHPPLPSPVLRTLFFLSCLFVYF